MGYLKDGKWVDQWYNTEKTKGRFQRTQATFRHWITRNPKDRFPAEAKRYHLYVSYACPWAHRTLIYRAIKGLENIIDVSVVDWHMGSQGWTFIPSEPNNSARDQLYHLQFAHQLYTQASPSFTGRVTVPILWDTQERTIVSNESADIIRMFNTCFDDIGAVPVDYYPKEHQAAIDHWNELIYTTINNGVYRCGFATTQDAYNEAVKPLFDTLAQLDKMLAKSRFLTGHRPLEADWRLFTTLIRFDAVYHTHFKCTFKRLIDYPNLWAYARDLFQWPGVARTVHMDHICHHYYGSHPTINPTGIVPTRPDMDWYTPHNRNAIGL